MQPLNDIQVMLVDIDGIFTAVVITNYARTTGLTIDYVAGEVLTVKCSAG
jgi:hypothetical protein